MQPCLAETGSRIGLVIGIEKYRTGGQLTLPVSDAKKVQASLVAAGFNAPAPLENPTKAELEHAIRDFSRRSLSADVAVLYFAGHGVQYQSDNWIIPSDATLEIEEFVVSQAIRLQDLVTQLGRAKLRVIILDACRDNPFVVNWRKERQIGGGLAQIAREALPVGTVVAFSAAAGQKAPDDGAYADALSKYIAMPGLELKQVFDRVMRSVVVRSGSATPVYTVAYEGSFSFVAGSEPERPDTGVFANVGGVVASVHVARGLRVKAGQLLISLQSTAFEHLVANNRAIVESLDARIARLQGLAEGAAASSEELRQLGAERQLAIVRLRDAQIKLGGTRIVAPFAGTIVSVLVDRAELVVAADGASPTRLLTIRRDTPVASID